MNMVPLGNGQARMVREDAPAVLLSAVNRSHDHANTRMDREDNAFLDALGTDRIVALQVLSLAVDFDAVPVAHRLATRGLVAILPGFRVVATPQPPVVERDLVLGQVRAAFRDITQKPMLAILLHFYDNLPTTVQAVEDACGQWAALSLLELWTLGLVHITEQGAVQWTGRRSPAEIRSEHEAKR